jgi:hypothetical protein
MREVFGYGLKGRGGRRVIPSRSRYFLDFIEKEIYILYANKLNILGSRESNLGRKSSCNPSLPTSALEYDP